MRAMILAAGLGTRMAPLAASVAKPALPVLDVPVVLRLARWLAEHGVERAVVNAHAHPESLRAAVREAPLPIDWVLEPELRGSGGGVLGARELLESDEPFLVLNGDMCLELDLRALVARHRQSGALLTLALRDDPRKREFGAIGYDPQGNVRRITERIDLGSEKGSGLFIGVQVMAPAVFARMPERARFEIIPEVWVPALRDGLRLASWLQPVDQAWWPVGSPHELVDANRAALAAAAPGGQVLAHPSARVDGAVQGPCWIGANAVIEAGAAVGPDAIVSAGARVARGARLERALALGGARLAAGVELRDGVAYGDQVWRDG